LPNSQRLRGVPCRAVERDETLGFMKAGIDAETRRIPGAAS
jgi:hypothetical protein